MLASVDEAEVFLGKRCSDGEEHGQVLYREILGDGHGHGLRDVSGLATFDIDIDKERLTVAREILNEDLHSRDSFRRSESRGRC